MQNSKLPKEKITLSRKSGLGMALCFFFLLIANYAVYAQHRFEYKHRQMGTQIRLVFYTVNKQKADSVSNLVFNRIDDLNNKLSDYIADSELNELTNSGIGSFSVSTDMYVVLKESIRISEKTNGMFDITAGPLIQLWRQTRKSRIKPTRAEMEATKEKVGYNHITFPAENTVSLRKLGIQLDLGGIGKGFAADEAIKILIENDITAALVDMGGDIRVSDAPPNKSHWLLAFAYYDGRGDEIIQKIQLKNAAVATSGDLYQYVEIDGVRYSHIVDPLTGMALTNGIQVTTIAENATNADAYASAMSVMGLERVKNNVVKLKGIEVFLVENGENGYRQWQSPAFKKFCLDD